ncbi:MAG: DUF1553 domain-containing protein [Planctomycetota bacterium]|nr:DUF1553 domain-containing protein [Planctomycetota bacterium]
MPCYSSIRIGSVCWLSTIFLGTVSANAVDKGVEFFERKIRPVLVERCYACHSAQAAAKEMLKGGLRLDTRQDTRKGGDSGPAAVPGKPADSLLIAAIRHETFKMPPQSKLSKEVIADFVKWIKLGAPDPRTGNANALAGISLPQARKRWAFQAPGMPQLPRVANTKWAASDMDRLLLAKLEANGLTPASSSDKRTLIRRATYDLLGLPPTADQVTAFLIDKREDAFARVIDRLLDSPDFGIRWARFWLDNVRYAQDDPTCAANSNGALSVGPYRDWVVKSLNCDLPYDRFIRLQVAGDLMQPKDDQLFDVDALTATGMWGLAHVVEGNDREKVVADFVDEQLDVLGRTFLGLTISCARCHDHKFDPIRQTDYYALAGIFYSSHSFKFDGESARKRVRTQERAYPTKAKRREFAPLEKQLAKVEQEIATLEDKYENPLELKKIRDELKVKLKEQPQTPNQKARLARRIKLLRDKETNLLADQEKSGWEISPPQLKTHAKLIVQRDGVKKKLASFPLRMVIREGPVPGTRHKASGDIRLFIRGNHLALGQKVARDVPSVFVARGTMKISGSGRRALADWLTKPEHPLTARVMANRVWQRLFGRGIVATPSNFGKLGRPPTHPELLDYLAARFVQNGWSIKKLIREIMLSQAYRQSSQVNARNLARDPDNRWFGRMNRKRLDAETLMDTLGWHAGRVRRATKAMSQGKLAVNGRSLYGEFSRDKPPTTLDLFDGANPDLLVPARSDSTSAPQALYMLNNDKVTGTAAKLAQRAMNLPSEIQRVNSLYLELFGRMPSRQERDVALSVVSQARKTRRKFATNKTQIEKGVWNDLCMAMICSNEFLYID